ncbi:MAG: peptide chain release factor N(5)-glutamine methyltransferase [Chloroflexota bacterium]
MKKNETVANMLAWAIYRLGDVSETPRLDAELLLRHVLSWSHARVIAEQKAIPSTVQSEAFRSLVERRAQHESIAYIVGHKEFYGLDFVVNVSVLVPRPETELLVELAIQHTHRLQRPLHIADIGTGSGCIAVTLATHLPDVMLYAVDISPDALKVAAENAARHNVTEKVQLMHGDLVMPLGDPMDMIVSNPPYTILSEIDVGVREHEPHLALDGGADGLAVYRRLLAAASSKLPADGVVLLEIGATQGDDVMALARVYFPSAQISVHQDLADHDRVVTIRNS